MPRRRASTLKASESETADLKSNLSVLANGTTRAQKEDEGEFVKRIETGQRLRQHLHQDGGSRHIKDAFRHVGGLQIVLSAFKPISAYIGLQTASPAQFQLFLDFVQTLFGVLSAALHEHRGNQRFFSDGLSSDGGWTLFAHHLHVMISTIEKDDLVKKRDLADLVFGCLLACSMEDESLIPLWTRLRHTGESDAASLVDTLPSPNILGSQKPLEIHAIANDVQDRILGLIIKAIDPSLIVHNPEAILVIIRLWRDGVDTTFEKHGYQQNISSSVLAILSHVVAISTHNLCAVHDAGILDTLLPCLTTQTLPAFTYRGQLLSLCKSLLELGVSSLKEAYFLYSNARFSSDVADLVLTTLKSSRTPPLVHFDLSLHGYASIELPSIGRSFPPQSASSGYTLSLWIQIVRFDVNSHTTLFGAFDASQTCFVLVYIEKDTHNIILQTSVTSPRPSVRFKSTAFREGQWYHVVITHQRPRGATSSRASLFVNGEFAEQVKSQYPASSDGPVQDYPPTQSRSTSAQESKSIQAFLGTPQDLATRIGRGLVLTQWRLASSHLFADVLTDDLIAVYYQLGPRYTGNFQDCLGSFQTYEASAALNIRNEGLHAGKEDASDIITAIRSKAGLLLPESSIILNICSSTVLDDKDSNNVNETQLIRHLSKSSAKSLWMVTRGGCNALAINGATPQINEALLHASGFAVLAGDPCCVIPGSMDEAAWCIAGCAPVCLALLDGAETGDDIVRSLNITFECVKNNWRNSEAMERDNGFGALATLLAQKLRNQSEVTADSSPKPAPSTRSGSSGYDIDQDVLMAILDFTGYCQEHPEESVINNPLAYRILVLDMEIWKYSSAGVQELYYSQFVTFASKSKYRHFNLKRLLRMRILKKWLEGLKSTPFSSQTFRYFLQAFKVIFELGVNAEAMRSLSLYITYAIHRSTQLRYSKSSKSRTHTPLRKRTLSNASPAALNTTDVVSTDMTELQVALQLFDMFTSLLCRNRDKSQITKFARTVTNKWLLHLLADDEATVISLATKILSRLLVVSGPAYMSKFVEKTGGIAILEHRLQRWWHIPANWISCLAILFGIDPAALDYTKQLIDPSTLLEMFQINENSQVVHAQILPVLAAMLRAALSALTRGSSSRQAPGTGHSRHKDVTDSAKASFSIAPSSRTTGLSVEIPAAGTPFAKSSTESENLVMVILKFLANIHARSRPFRDFAATSTYVQEIFTAVFPGIVRTHLISPSAELSLRESNLPVQDQRVLIRPLGADMSDESTANESLLFKDTPKIGFVRKSTPRRMSSYVLVSADGMGSNPAIPKDSDPSTSTIDSAEHTSRHTQMIQDTLDLAMLVFADQMLVRKDFPGLGLFQRVPCASHKSQVHFESYVLRYAIDFLQGHIKQNQDILCEPKVLTNLSRFSMHVTEAIYEGWYVDGAETLVGFLAEILEYLHLPNISAVKSVRLCSQIIVNLRTTLLKVILLRLSELGDGFSTASTISFLEKLAYWQVALQQSEDAQLDSFHLLCFLLFDKLVNPEPQIRMAAANLWRMLLVQKPEEITTILRRGNTPESVSLANGFEKIMELDNDAFLGWVDDHRKNLESALFHRLSKTWNNFVVYENGKTLETAKARIAKRREKLKAWDLGERKNAETVRRHEISTDHWRSNIFASEDLKRQRTLQDQQDNQMFNISTWAKMRQGLQRPGGLLEDASRQKWQLDLTEGRNRMRMRLIPDLKARLHDYQPKRRQSQGPSRGRRSTGPMEKVVKENAALSITSGVKRSETLDFLNGVRSESSPGPTTGGDNIDDLARDNDFEIVEGPQELEYEDKNRKVMRSLQRGDQIEHVNNVARIIGLEAVEGLLILGKTHLYLLDHLFQRSDGEVVNAWQAPQEERDAYLQMISGRASDNKISAPVKGDYETRSWRWQDIVSVSKRRFLFRDVALELFFVDGRSYLLTASSAALRDDLYQKLMSMAADAGGQGSSSGEDSWRVDLLRNPTDEMQNLGSKFANVFSSSLNPVTRKWIKREISNFQYLMLINTMAGRTFNDLTQYPVFPWVIADYTSEELDLTDPKSFRDLSQPMGCQSKERGAVFRDRYRSFAEMGDQNSQPFHYGTHYSSAMIVTSYLIRMQPFVQSYLLLQGGSFDHADRLFYSIEKAWSSASKDNMTDVRELIPEFFYLPNFLTNINGYDLGTRQADGESIADVSLPPWAKGDSKIFIAKNREALESDYVSQHLHLWIDLIFGHKQRGDSAVEATNVFHYLSYHGARDLDSIEDPLERMATIGIIHNFGQTPHQIFHKPHPSSEDQKVKVRRLDSAAENLTRLPFPIAETNDRISCLQYSTKYDRIVPSGAFRLDISPTFDKHMIWGFVDNGVRFYASDTRKILGLFEHVHQKQLSCAQFADSKTLVTAGNDCTVSVWTMIATSASVDLHPRATLFGHRESVNVIASSRSFSALLSASTDGMVYMWDLNRLEFVRILCSGSQVDCARINDMTGTILLCRGAEVSVWTLNGDLLLKQDIFAEGEDQVHSCSFYEGTGNEYLERDLIFTGQKRGVVNVWNVTIRHGAYVLEHIKSMHHLDQAGYNIGAPITAVLPMAHAVFTGDDDGRVYEWDCIQRQ